MYKSPFAIVLVLLVACQENKSTHSKAEIITEVKGLDADTLYKMLDQVLALDSFTFSNWDPFLFIQTGYFLTPTEKNAILVFHPTDSTYEIEIHSMTNKGWVKMDELVSQDAFPMQFRLNYEDYNFDRHKDIYVQSTMSNGYALSRGHVYLRDPTTGKFENLPEAEDLANMTPDFKTKTLFSETVYYDDLGWRGVCFLSNKWVNGKLITIKKECSDWEEE